MLKEALEYLFDRGRESASGLLTIGGKAFLDDQGQAVLVDANGVSSRVRRWRNPVDQIVTSFDSFVESAARFDLSLDTDMHIYVGDTEIVACEDLDAKDPRDRWCVRFPLKETNSFVAFSRPTATLNHKAFLQYLLRSGVSEAGELRLILSSLDFSRQSNTRSSAGGGAESMGRSVDQAVKGKQEIPEVWTFGIQRWEGVPVSVQLTSVVHIDLTNEQFQLQPVEAALDNAIAGSRVVLLERLKSAITSETVHFVEGRTQVRA